MRLNTPIMNLKDIGWEAFSIPLGSTDVGEGNQVDSTDLTKNLFCPVDPEVFRSTYWWRAYCAQKEDGRK
jgi:hypothetical protein